MVKSRLFLCAFIPVFAGFSPRRIHRFHPLRGLEDFDPNVLASVQTLLTPQPWPDGIHKEVAEKLGISNKVVSQYINELVRRGIFIHQVDGQLFPGGETG